MTEEQFKKAKELNNDIRELKIEVEETENAMEETFILRVQYGSNYFDLDTDHIDTRQVLTAYKKALTTRLAALEKEFKNI